MMKKSSWCHVIAKIAGIVLLLGTIVAIVFVLHPIKSSRHPASDGNEQRYSSTKDTSASNKDRSKGESLDAKGNASNKKGDSSKKNSKKKVSYINKEGSDLTTRIRVPEGFTRIDVTDGSFAAYLRSYPLKPADSPLLLYDGSEKANQADHVAIFSLPIENADLQQCADSIMRIYAEYYYSKGQYDQIGFHFTNGFYAEYAKWRQGYRILVKGSTVSWVKSAEASDSYESFEKYLHVVFNYAGTASMQSEASPISIDELQIGDVFLKGGSPGHVVMVVDICQNEKGEKAFLLAQGYMPAQEFHILKNPKYSEEPWYYADEVTYPFKTPEYTFQEGSLMRLNY